MSHARSIPETLLFNMVAVTLLSTVIVGSFWIWTEYGRFNQSAAMLHATQVEARQSLMRDQVDQVANYINFRRGKVERELQEMLRSRAREAHAVAERLHARYQGTLDAEGMKEIIRESLRAMRYDDGRGCYFAIESGGILEVSTERSALEGTSITELPDPRAVEATRQLLALGRAQGEGGLVYACAGETAGTTRMKAAHVIYFEPLGWTIGTGEYLDFAEQKLRREVLEWLEQIRFGEGYYLFAGQWDGLSLSGPARGQNMYDVADPNGVKIVQSLIERARGGGGFVNYVMPKIDGQRPAPKISYVQGIEGWNWYVGTGVYIDDIERTVAVFRAEKVSELSRSIGGIFLLVLVLLAASVWIAARMARGTRRAFEGFTAFFDQVSRGEAALVPGGGGYREFESLAESASRMVERRHAAEEALRQSEERLHVLFAQAADAMYVSDLSGRLVQVNRQAAVATGYSEEELLGMNVTEVDADVTDPTALAGFYQALSPGRTATLSSRHRRKDGSTFPVEITVALLDAPDGPLVFGIARDISERMQRQVEYARVIETALDAFWVIDSQGWILETNPAASAMLGYTREEFQKLRVSDVDVELPQEEIEIRFKRLQALRAISLTSQHRRKDGTLVDVEVSASHLPFGDGRVVAFIRDVTERNRAEAERRRLEAQLQQAQKMEAVGQLTGGVAHDFNNLLQVINAGADIALTELGPDHPVRSVLLEIFQAGDRASALIRQLLVFSRRQIMRPEPLDLNAVIDEVLRLIQRIIGEHIEVAWSPGEGIGAVHADRGMVEQALMNLCVNARDAMPEGGVLGVETALVALDEAFCAGNAWAVAGRYARLTVRDTGCGMDEAALTHIFEPFYSTKAEGKGTGLGLSTVYGTIKQHGGLIQATSTPGAGATFSLYWPLSTAPLPAVAMTIAAAPRGGNETILLAEDDEMVRGIAQRILSTAGYRVLVAADGKEALELFEQHRDAIDLVLLDVVMPRMSGREAFEIMRRQRPDLKVLFASGYSESAIHKNFVLDGTLRLLQKPYTRGPLLQAVRAVLEGKSSP